MLTLPHLLRIAHPAAAIHTEIDRLVDRWPSTAYPPVGMWTSTDEAVVRAELPGFALDQIEVEVREHTLRISGERTTDGEREYLRRERWIGRFDRRVHLPFAVDADAAQARLTDGILEIRLPRLEADKPRKIEIAVQ